MQIIIIIMYLYCKVQMEMDTFNCYSDCVVPRIIIDIFLSYRLNCDDVFYVQLKIQHVHLRFEDDFSNPEKPFSFGVCINNVCAQNPSRESVSHL